MKLIAIVCYGTEDLMYLPYDESMSDLDKATAYLASVIPEDFPAYLRDKISVEVIDAEFVKYTYVLHPAITCKLCHIPREISELFNGFVNETIDNKNTLYVTVN